jgi:hypothetical protein
MNLNSAVGGFLRSRGQALSVIPRIISLQPINSPYRFRQYRLLTLYFTRNYDEMALMRSLRQPPAAVSRMKKNRGERHAERSRSARRCRVEQTVYSVISPEKTSTAGPVM